MVTCRQHVMVSMSIAPCISLESFWKIKNKNAHDKHMSKVQHVAKANPLQYNDTKRSIDKLLPIAYSQHQFISLISFPFCAAKQAKTQKQSVNGKNLAFALLAYWLPCR